MCIYVCVYIYISWSTIKKKQTVIVHIQYQRYPGEQKLGRYRRVLTPRFCLCEDLKQAKLISRDRNHQWLPGARGGEWLEPLRKFFLLTLFTLFILMSKPYFCMCYMDYFCQNSSNHAWKICVLLYVNFIDKIDLKRKFWTISLNIMWIPWQSSG